LLALALTLSACHVKVSSKTDDNGSTNATTDATADVRQARWNAQTAKQLSAAIADRAAHGLDHVNFGASGEPGSADGDASLTRSALTYAAALAGGAADPAKLYDLYTLPRARPDLRRGLEQALQSGHVDAWLASLAPQDANYRKLSAAYVALRGKGNTPAPAIPVAGDAIKPGASDPRVPVIARQLMIFDYLPTGAGVGDRYSGPMVAAMKAMQADYGIKPDGVIGDDALAILNLSDADRARAIAVNMERLRWLERSPAPTRIDVNLAAARLSYWRDGKLVDTRKVVVGEPGKETPQIAAPIFRLVANPTWTVPRSVQQKEIAGKGAGYLRANHMVWKDGWIVQQSGPKNSLGLVKFDMKDDQAIYLHDTPAKALFTQVQRQRSHGCVRVEDALGFAERLAQDEGLTDAWHAARATGKETFVKLPREIPVRLIYQTVLLDEDGNPIVRSDPYQWNDRVATALGLPGGTSYKLKTNETDVGP
jgi:murein L,D-transpeptidase YcbB/YkuD